jgi:hypothetical protein
MTELHQPGGNADTTADHGHETVAQRGREQPDGRLVQRRPTVQAARSGVRDPRLRQQLATDDRVDPVGTDVAGGRHHQREKPAGQALSECQATACVQVQPVSLPPRSQCRVPLEHRDGDTAGQQALRKTQAAEATAGHGHPQLRHVVTSALTAVLAPYGPVPAQYRQAPVRIW